MMVFCNLFNTCKSGNETAINFLLDSWDKFNNIKDRNNEISLVKTWEKSKFKFNKIFNSSRSQYK